jgi:hypothetical protein
MDPFNFFDSHRNKLHKIHGKNKSNRIQITYILGLIVWLLIVVIFELYDTDLFGLLILSIPIFVFFISLINAPYLTVDTENTIYGFNYLPIGLSVVILIITLMNTHYEGNKEKVIVVTVLALMIAVFSAINIPVRPKWISLIRHIRSILQTYSLSLIIYGLYIYYRGRKRHLSSSNSLTVLAAI